MEDSCCPRDVQKRTGGPKSKSKEDHMQEDLSLKSKASANGRSVVWSNCSRMGVEP